MNSSFDFFDKVYCINIKDREDRWKESIQEFNKIGIADRVNRFEGVRYEDLPWPIAGRAGCTMAFRNVIQEANDLNLNNVFIFEDDITFIHPKEFIEQNLKLSIKELINYKWDIFYLGMNPNDDLGIYPLERIQPNLLKIKSCHCLHAVAFNRNIFKEILEAVPEDKNEVVKWVQSHINFDAWLQRYIIRNKECFCTNEYMVTQRASKSDIDLRITDYTQHIVDTFYKFRPA